MNGRQMRDLVNYIVETFGTSERPQVLKSGGLYIWNADGSKILAGPFNSMEHALDAKSEALDRAIKFLDKRQ